jgi:hypothetical protein
MRDLHRIPPLLGMGLLLGSIAVLLPFPVALPDLGGFAFYFLLLSAAVTLLAWWMRRRRGHLLVGAAAIALAGLCFVVGVGLARRLWFLQRFHAQAMESCRDVHEPSRGDGPWPGDEIFIKYGRRREVARQQALAAAHVPESVAAQLGLDCDGAQTSAYIYEGFDARWFIEPDGRMWSLW